MAEPDALVRGKVFHRRVQADWLRIAQGDIRPESPIVKPNGRRGRLDIKVDGLGGMVAVLRLRDAGAGEVPLEKVLLVTRPLEAQSR